MRIRRPGQTYFHVGLFGALGAMGVIRSVGLVDVDVNVAGTGDNTMSRYVGGLVGSSYGKIAASYVVGGVVHGDAILGGLAGRIGSGGIVIASYANVFAHTRIGRVGGLVGLMDEQSIVSASYAIGGVQEDGGFDQDFGGLVGSFDPDAEIRAELL